MQIIGGQIGTVLSVEDREYNVHCKVLLMIIHLKFQSILNDEEWRERMKAVAVNLQPLH